MQMVLSNDGKEEPGDQAGKLPRVRLAGELIDGRRRAGESLKLSEIAARYPLDEDSVLNVFRELQPLGMVSLF